MADKSTTIYEPINTDVETVTIIFEAGVATSVEASCVIRSSEPRVTHRGNSSDAASTYSSGVQAALATLATEAAVKVATGQSF